MSVWVESRKTKRGRRYYVCWRAGESRGSAPAGEYHSTAISLRNKKQEELILQTNNLLDKNLTCKDAFNRYIGYLQAAKRRKKTIEINKWAGSKLLLRMGDKKVHLIQPSDLENLKHSLLVEGGHSPNGLNIIIRSLKAFFAYCALQKIVIENPAKEWNQEQEEPVGQMLSPEDAQKIIEKGCAFNPELAEIVKAFLYTGLRARELLSLRSEDIFEDYLLVRTETSKTKRERAVPLHPDVRVFFQFWKREAKKWRYGRLQQAFERAVKRSKVGKRVRLHDLRHTAASWLLRFGGLTLEEAARLLGHTQLKTTQRYSHFEKHYLQEKVNRIDFGKNLGNYAKIRENEGNEVRAELIKNGDQLPS